MPSTRRGCLIILKECAWIVARHEDAAPAAGLAPGRTPATRPPLQPRRRSAANVGRLGAAVRKCAMLFKCYEYNYHYLHQCVIEQARGLASRKSGMHCTALGTRHHIVAANCIRSHGLPLLDRTFEGRQEASSGMRRPPWEGRRSRKSTGSPGCMAQAVWIVMSRCGPRPPSQSCRTGILPVAAACWAARRLATAATSSVTSFRGHVRLLQTPGTSLRVMRPRCRLWGQMRDVACES
jgi:hypothetical protein